MPDLSTTNHLCQGTLQTLPYDNLYAICPGYNVHPYFYTFYLTLRIIFRRSLNSQKTGLSLAEHVPSQSEASPPMLESWREDFLTLFKKILMTL